MYFLYLENFLAVFQVCGTRKNSMVLYFFQVFFISRYFVFFPGMAFLKNFFDYLEKIVAYSGFVAFSGYFFKIILDFQVLFIFSRYDIFGDDYLENFGDLLRFSRSYLFFSG